MIENTLATISSCGLLVNNLCQLQNGTWRASLRKADISGYEFGTASTPNEALLKALYMAQALPGVPLIPNTMRSLAAQKLSLESLDL